MTKIVGLTGGIGSGKTTVAQMFKALGVPVYNADNEAKVLMQSSEIIKGELIQLLGDTCYQNGQLNRSFIASKVFADKALLEKINAIVHPKVAAHFEQWLFKQKAPYVIKEVAILFETETQHLFDFILTVTAPVETRIQRVMDRDQKTKLEVEMVIKNQLSEDEKINQSDFVIFNNIISETERDVIEIHNKITKTINKS
ncbi:dephospho-CoA kinase [Flavobacteriaceae bacterium]|nr:dephospho-CoA kinase [Flavobacteriaceae bacterium]